MGSLSIFRPTFKTHANKFSKNNTKNTKLVFFGRTGRKPVYFADTSYERRDHNAANIDFAGLSTAEETTAKKNHEKDLNIDERISLFKNQLKNEFIYRIPLRFISDIGKINFPTKIDYRIKLFL